MGVAGRSDSGRTSSRERITHNRRTLLIASGLVALCIVGVIGFGQIYTATTGVPLLLELLGKLFPKDDLIGYLLRKLFGNFDIKPPIVP